MPPSRANHLIWFDTEYTSLDLDRAHLLQVAMIVTDAEGRRVAAPELDLVTPVALPDGVQVSEFVAKECPDLLRQAREPGAPPPETVDAMLAERLDALLGPPAAKVKERPILAGNTIHADWRMATRFLPRFLDRLHYRLLDVSSLKTLWLNADKGVEFDKENTSLLRQYLPGWSLPDAARRHDALYDVMASVAELNFYRRNLLLP